LIDTGEEAICVRARRVDFLSSPVFIQQKRRSLLFASVPASNVGESAWRNDDSKAVSRPLRLVDRVAAEGTWGSGGR
jgi:hypothetical protein